MLMSPSIFPPKLIEILVEPFQKNNTSELYTILFKLYSLQLEIFYTGELLLESAKTNFLNIGGLMAFTKLSVCRIRENFHVNFILNWSCLNFSRYTCSIIFISPLPPNYVRLTGISRTYIPGTYLQNLL